MTSHDFLSLLSFVAQNLDFLGSGVPDIQSSKCLLELQAFGDRRDQSDQKMLKEVGIESSGTVRLSCSALTVL